jgi:hypothetical protein
MKNYFIVIVSLLLTTHVLQSQTTLAPHLLRYDLLLHTDKVSKNGIPESVPLETAVQQKGIYQFAQVFNKQPTFTWEVDTAVKALTAYRILVATTVTQNTLTFAVCFLLHSDLKTAIFKWLYRSTGTTGVTHPEFYTCGFYI